MGLFTKKIGPVFLKETSESTAFIEKLEELQKRATGDVATKIEQQINIARYGELGEKNIAFELKNSGMDMYILHDICLTKGDLSAQIDYLVVTRKCTYILECKNLIGNIEIDNKGAFVRTYPFKGRTIKEGIYSPITQNERHLQILKEIRKENKKNFIEKYFFEKYFDDNYKSMVVLANPKTYLNDRFAPKHIKSQVIRADQLISFIKKQEAQSTEPDMNNDAMLELAEFYLEKNNSQRSDYAKKYEEMVQELKIPVKEVANESSRETVEAEITSDETEIVKRLKEFRLSQSRLENIKPYYIFSDAQMNDLINRAPHCKEELLEVQGFGKVKVDKYGDVILKILAGNL